MKNTTFFKTDIVRGRAKPHLNIVISDQDSEGCVLVVNATTYYGTGREDTSCILMPGEHSCITVKSFIAYHFAYRIHHKKILEHSMNNIIDIKNNIDDSVLARIQNGAKKSKRLRNEFKSFFSLF